MDRNKIFLIALGIGLLAGLANAGKSTRLDDAEALWQLADHTAWDEVGNQESTLIAIENAKKLVLRQLRKDWLKTDDGYSFDDTVFRYFQHSHPNTQKDKCCDDSDPNNGATCDPQVNASCTTTSRGGQTVCSASSTKC